MDSVQQIYATESKLLLFGISLFLQCFKNVDHYHHEISERELHFIDTLFLMCPLVLQSTQL